MIQVYHYIRHTSETDRPDDVPKWARNRGAEASVERFRQTIGRDPERWANFVTDFLTCVYAPGVYATCLLEPETEYKPLMIMRGYTDRNDVYTDDENLGIVSQGQLETLAGGSIVCPIEGVPYVGVVQCKTVMLETA